MKRPFATALLAGGLLLAMPASAQSVERFYAGKTVTILIGFGPGGSHDYYAHLAARHLGRFIPSHPTIVPENMPGAGSFKAANYLYAVAPRDGTAIGIVTQTVALEEALGSQGSSTNRPSSTGSAAPPRSSRSSSPGRPRPPRRWAT
jgi:tripartite-type tricarboxylate transporter receptor subunit TctC